jgi:GNAT superfamily N-acetyltransferase
VLFLIDSNVSIASDPLSPVLEPGADAVLQFLRLVSKHHHDVRTHQASRLDFGRIADPTLRAARLALFEKFEPLANPPTISQQQRDTLGTPPPGSNNAVDQALLAAIVGNAAGHLVTDDQGIHSKARRMGVGERVVTARDAVALLRALHVDLPITPPAVRRAKTHELNIDDPIFDALKADYDGFVAWFNRAAQNQRDALLIDGDITDDTTEHAAIAILKREPAGEYGLPKDQLKICTFKVADGYSGQKYGELLLKATFEQAHVERDAGLYVTVFDKQQSLIALLTDFGFREMPGVLTEAGERVYAKPHGGTPALGLDALQQHIRHGPPWLSDDAATYVIPIEPTWHRTLFPDAEPSDENALFSSTFGLTVRPHGNALRKAYLCNAPSRLLQPGDSLLFYRSSDEKAVYVVGVCEETFVSTDAAEIAAAVGKRTVYSLEEIQQLARQGDVLVVMFRQDRVLRDKPVRLAELTSANALKSWPQSITRIRPEGAAWLAQRLDE